LLKSFDHPIDFENAASGSLRPRILSPALFAFVHAERTYNQLCPIDLLGRHEGGYKRVIGGDDSNDVYSLALEFGVFLDIRREMFDLTSGSECSWNSKQNNFLSLEFL
jgi:hypothetical protein